MEERSESQNSTLTMLHQEQTRQQNFLPYYRKSIFITFNKSECCAVWNWPFNSLILVFVERIMCHPQISLNNEVFVVVAATVPGTALNDGQCDYRVNNFFRLFALFIPLSKIGQMKIARTFDLIQRLTGEKTLIRYHNLSQSILLTSKTHVSLSPSFSLTLSFSDFATFLDVSVKILFVWPYVCSFGFLFSFLILCSWKIYYRLV